MPSFRYRALTPGGQPVEGVLDATDPAACIARLNEMGYLPLRADPVGGAPRLSLTLSRAPRSRLTRKELVLLTRELATLLDARLPVDRALEVLVKLGASGPVKALVSDVLERLRGGAGLSDAMAAHPATFPPFYVAMLRAGEAGGAPEVVLKRMADHLEKSAALRDSVRSALAYPVILLGMVAVTILVMLVVVLPQFQGMFEEAGSRLPTAAILVVRAGELARQWWWLTPLPPLVLGFAIAASVRTPRGRLLWHGRLLRLPLVGGLVAKLETARLARTLATLLANGIPLLQGLSIVKDIVGNAVIRQGIGDIAASLTKGQGLAGPLERLGCLPPLAVQLIAVGEETAQLEPMLGKIADIFEREVQVAFTRMVDLLTPLLTIVLGLVVAAIVGAILSAILSVYSLPV